MFQLPRAWFTIGVFELGPQRQERVGIDDVSDHGQLGALGLGAPDVCPVTQAFACFLMGSSGYVILCFLAKEVIWGDI